MKFYNQTQLNELSLDFIDVFYLLTYHSLQNMLDAYSKKYAHSTPIVALKALTYFDDIDPHLDPPKMKDERKLRSAF